MTIYAVTLKCEKTIVLPAIKLKSEKPCNINFIKDGIYRGFEEGDTITFWENADNGKNETEFFITNIKNVINKFTVLELEHVCGDEKSYFLSD